MYRVQLTIDGNPRLREVFERRNPLTHETVTVATDARAEDVQLAVDAAARAFPSWSALGPSVRRRHLSNAAHVLRGRGEEFARRMSAETGATPSWAQFNVHLAALLLDEAAALTTQVSGETIPSNHPGTLALSVRKPVGVVAGMAPWNAPVILGVRAIATPLACGNTVVLKASELCPATHSLIGEVLLEAGLPAHVVTVLTHSAPRAPEITEALIAHPAVRRVNFTGSTPVGRIVGELAGRHLKPAVLELSGKAPMVVLDDADLDAALDAAIFAAFMNQGQTCMSTERIVVQGRIADDFIARFRERAQSLVVAPANNASAQLGPVVDASTALRLQDLVDDAVAKGADCVCGGFGEGVLYRATIIDRVTRDMRLFHEESFGPIVGVTRVSTDEQAVSVANDSAYGLTASVFGRDLTRALKVAQRIESGICHINSSSLQDEPQMPFGGVKASGFGRFGGRAGIQEFTDLRWLTIATEPRQYPF